MADFTPNPSSPAQFLDLMAQDSPLNKYLAAQKAQGDIGIQQQQYNENALKAQYAPQDLYNQAMQQKTATIKGMKPFEAGMMESLLNRISAPTSSATDMMVSRILGKTDQQNAIPPFQPGGQVQGPDVMGKDITNKASEVINRALPANKQIRTPQSIVMPQMQQQIDSMNAQAAAKAAQPGFSQIQQPQGPQQIGPQDMTRAPAQAVPPFGYNPTPSGINMGDQMAVAKFAQGVDPNQMLSTDLEKVFPSTASAMAMSMRNLPSAMAGMANNQNTTMTQLLEKQNALEQLKSKNLNDEQLQRLQLEEKTLKDEMDALRGVETANSRPKGGARVPKSDDLSNDKKSIDDLKTQWNEAQQADNPRKAMRELSATIARKYQTAATPWAKQEIWNTYADTLSKQGLGPPGTTPSNPVSKMTPPATTKTELPPAPVVKMINNVPVTLIKDMSTGTWKVQK